MTIIRMMSRATKCVLLLTILSVLCANAQAVGKHAGWDDAYFRMPFQHNSQWLDTNMYLRLAIRRVDKPIDTLSQEEVTELDQAFVKLIEVVRQRDPMAAREVIFGFQKRLSDEEMRQGIAQFSAALDALSDIRLRYVVPMTGGGLYIVSALDRSTNQQTVRTYRISQRDNGTYGYAVGRVYAEHEALIVRLFMAAALRPDLFSELSLKEIIKSGVNFGLSFVPDEQQREIGITVPYELLMNASAVNIPFLGDVAAGTDVPEVIQFYRQAFATIVGDGDPAALEKYFDKRSLKRLHEGINNLGDNSTSTMRELFSMREIKLLVNADPLWAVIHVQRNDDPGIVATDLYQTDFVVREANGEYRIVQMYSLPILKSVFATDFVQREGFDRIVSGELVGPNSAVRKIEAPPSSLPWSMLILVLVVAVLIVSTTIMFKRRQTAA